MSAAEVEKVPAIESAPFGRLQADMEHVKTDIAEIKSDVRALRAEIGSRFDKADGKFDGVAGEFKSIRADMRTDFRWLLSLMIAGFGALAGMMAHGFKWI